MQCPIRVAGIFVCGIEMQLTKYLLTEPLGADYVLLVNCLSGAVDFLDQNTHDALKSKQFNKLSNKIIEALIDRGYLFRKKEHQTRLISQLYEKYSLSIDKYTDFVVCPTFDCNLACPYCFQKDLNAANLYLSKDAIPLLTRAINELDRLTGNKKAVQLFGGEPLLPKNKPFINELLQYCNLKNIPVAITTNGTQILNYSKLLNAYKHLIKMTQITIDGPPEIHNNRRVPKNGSPTFNIIIKGIEFLLSRSVSVHARVNVDTSNVLALPKLAAILSRKGLIADKNFRCSIAPVANHCTAVQNTNLFDETALMQQLDDLRIEYPQLEVLSSDRIPKTIKHLNSVMNGTYSSPRFTYCRRAGVV